MNQSSDHNVAGLRDARYFDITDFHTYFARVKTHSVVVVESRIISSFYPYTRVLRDTKNGPGSKYLLVGIEINIFYLFIFLKYLILRKKQVKKKISRSEATFRFRPNDNVVIKTIYISTERRL